ncbi:MAG TPA: protein TonB, partial [Gammaproteobacteria bacterium]|nr:protein TonB [Gammaproteobacteria bacterium]
MVRYLSGLALSIVTTFLLFFLMQSLIQSDKSALTEGVKGKLIDFVRVQDDVEVQTRTRKPTPPPPPEEPPTMPTMPPSVSSNASPHPS